MTRDEILCDTPMATSQIEHATPVIISVVVDPSIHTAAAVTNANLTITTDRS
jgi:hypothetical protein